MNKALKHDVDARLLKLLYGNSLFAIQATIIIAVVMALELWHKVESPWANVWVMVFAVITTSRYLALRNFQSARYKHSDRFWQTLFLVNIFITGVLWGSTALFFDIQTERVHWFLVLFILTGLTGGALPSLSADYRAYILFMIPALSPIMVRLFLESYEHGVHMGLLIILYMMLTTLMSRRSYKFLTETVTLQIEHETMGRIVEEQLHTVEEQQQQLLDTQYSLREVNELFERAFDTTHVMYAYLDTAFNFIRVNKAYADAVEQDCDYFVGKNHFVLYPDEENQRIFQGAIDSGEVYHVDAKSFEYPEQPEKGTTYWDWSLTPVLNEKQEIVGLLLAIIDVTERQRAQMALQEKEDYLQAIMDTAMEAILTMNENGVIEMVNPAVEKIFGYSRDELIGKEVTMLMPKHMAQKHQEWVEHYLADSNKVILGRRIETEGTRKDGSIFPLSISVSANIVHGKRIFTSVMSDITEQRAMLDTLKQKNTELEYLSSHDALTGIHNRRSADEFLRREWSRAYRNKTCIAVLMIDVDFFKKFNDIYGHQVGDNCLQDVARALRNSLLRPTDFVGRFGGEEFIVILPDTSIDGAFEVADRMRAKVEALEIPHDQSPFEHITASIGVVAIVPNNIENLEKLVTCADKALYEAKNQGRNRVACMEDDVEVA